MNRAFGGIVLAILLLVILAGAVWAQDYPPGRDQKFEQEILDRLSKISPPAVPLFTSATAAMDAGNYAAAKTGFEKVLELVPDFPDAVRRLSSVYLYLNDLTNAEKMARHAVELSDAPENKAALAGVLLEVNTPKSNMEAFYLAKEAVSTNPDDLYNQYILLLTGASVNDIPTVREVSAVVIRMAPKDPAGHFYSGLVLAMDQKWEQAERELLLARTLGADAEMIQSLLDEGIATQALIQRLIRFGLYALAAWAIMLGLLFLVGLVLSRATMAAVNRQKGLTSVEISPGERLVRRVYRVVIAITSFYFYLSIPVLLLAVVAPIAFFFYLFLVIGSIPIRGAIFLLVMGAYTLFAVVRSLFVRRKDTSDPGREISRADASYLWQLLTDTARQLNTRPVDKVYAVLGTEIGVTERGSLFKRLRGKGQRCLILGLGALPGMNQGQFQAIIAHEYGHFSNADTAGGDLARQVLFTIHNMAYGLGQVGTATWINPVWWFINGYYRIYLRITQGASRLQEILADRYAAVQFGVENSRSSLTFITRQNLLFNYQLNQEVNDARTETRGLNNLFTLPPVNDCAEIDQEYAKEIEAHTSPYDSHPSLRDRLGFIERIKRPGYEQLDSRPVWDLIPSAAYLQEQITREVETNLRKRGILEPG